MKTYAELVYAECKAAADAYNADGSTMERRDLDAVFERHGLLVELSQPNNYRPLMERLRRAAVESRVAA